MADEIKQGWMTKLGKNGSLSSWQKRWFVLTDNTLKYFKSEKMEECKGTITLHGAMIIDVDPSEYKQDFAIGVREGALGNDSERVYILVPESEAAKIAWLESLIAVVGAAKADNVIYQGELLKLGDLVKSWKRRHFVLTPQAITYYVNKGDKFPAGEISLLFGATITPESDVAYGKQFTFTVCPNSAKSASRSYVLVADNELELRRWIRSVQDVLSDGSHTHLQHAKLESTLSSKMLQNLNFIRDSKGSSRPNGNYLVNRKLVGWLKKRGKVRRNWNRRYFILSSSVLYYFKEASDATPQSAAEGIGPQGEVIMMGATVVIDPSIDEFGFTISPSDNKRKYLLVADSTEEMKQWVKELSACTVSSGSQTLNLTQTSSALFDNATQCDTIGNRDGGAMQSMSSHNDPVERMSRESYLGRISNASHAGGGT